MTAEASGAPAAKPTVSFDDFLRLDIRVAKVIEASDHPNADKLIVMKIDLGGEQRQIIAGLRPWYSAEALRGKQIVVVTNLAPRKMRGMDSQGMLLAATIGQGPDMNVVLLGVEKDVPVGCTIS